MKTELTPNDITRLREIANDESILTYDALSEVAISYFEAHTEFQKLRLLQVCGPISTGLDTQTWQERVDDIHDAANHFAKQKNIVVFDQLPFEEPITAIKQRRLKAGKTEEGVPDQAIIHQFYKPVFLSQTKRVILMFLPTFLYSNGACEEHRLGLIHPNKIENRYIRHNWRHRIKLGIDIYRLDMCDDW